MVDSLTGLMWPKNANLADRKTWQEALDFANSLTSLCGHDDWRLPNIIELGSLRNAGAETGNAAWLTSQGFNNVLNPYNYPYWSSSYVSTYSSLTANSAWVVYIHTGYNATDNKGTYYYVWPVRGGQSSKLISPSNLTAKATSSSKIVLHWRDNSYNETGFKIERKKGGCSSANVWTEVPASITVDMVTYTNSALDANTTYSYRIRAYNASRDSAYSSCASAKTAMAGTPNSPTNLKANSKSTNKVTLTWIDNATNDTRVEIYRKSGANKFALLDTIESADVQSYADMNATGNNSTTAYSYYVKACNTAGCAPATNSAAVPYIPTVPKATPSTGKINFTWTDNSSNERGFQVYRKEGTCSSANAWSLLSTRSANVKAYIDVDVTSGSAYSYKVRAFTQTGAQPYARGYSMYTGCLSAVAP